VSNYTIHSIMYHVIRNSCPQIQIWPPRWPPQTAAARNAPEHIADITELPPT